MHKDDIHHSQRLEEENNITKIHGCLWVFIGERVEGVDRTQFFEKNLITVICSVLPSPNIPTASKPSALEMAG